MLGEKRKGERSADQKPAQAGGFLPMGFEYVQLSPEREQEILDGFHAIREALYERARGLERFASDDGLRFTI